MASTCRSCKAPVLWVKNKATGKREPLDPDPVADGNVEIIGEAPADDYFGAVPYVRHLLKGEDSLPGMGGERYVSHFATCPDADKHRRRP